MRRFPPFPVPARIANLPRPLPPDSIDVKDWLHYYADLACWQAMRADVLRYGIVEDAQELLDYITEKDKEDEKPKSTKKDKT